MSISVANANLWLAVYLPHLMLDSLAQTGQAQTDPLLVVQHNANASVRDANRAARQAGVVPGMSLAEALALLQTPRLIEHDPQREEQQLRTLGAVLQQFSSQIHRVGPGPCLLLEAGRSLRLFRGLPAFRDQVQTTLRALGYSARLGVAPTPSAACLFATHALPAQPTDVNALRLLLEPLPLDVLPLPEHTREALQAVGCRRIGDLLALPFQGLRIRYGAQLPDLLLRLLGLQPEVLPRFQVPETLRFELDLLYETDRADSLSFPLRRLLQQLEQALRARQQGVQRLFLELRHRAAVTTWTLDCGQPGQQAQRWLQLWQLHLARAQLPAPVAGLCLQAGALLPIDRQPPSLFATLPPDSRATQRGNPSHRRPSEHEHWLHSSPWIARIQARLGTAAVLRLLPTANPLPEAAQTLIPVENPGQALPVCSVTPAQQAAGAALWLPIEPENAPAAGGTGAGTGTGTAPRLPVRPPSDPWNLAAGIRLGRMEGGWWAPGGDQRRDYIVLPDRQGRLRWLFQDLRSGQWQEQGLWG